MKLQYPNATPEQRKFMTARALVDMYNYWEQQAMVQPSRNPIVTQVCIYTYVCINEIIFLIIY